MKQSRHQSRFMCVQALYQGLLTKFDVVLGTFLKENKIEKVDNEFVSDIYEGVKENLDMLDKQLSNALKRKKFEYLVTLQKAVLYAAAYEYYFKNISKGILIKEYVLLSKRFFHDDEYKLVHAAIHNLADKAIIDKTLIDKTLIDKTLTDDTLNQDDDISSISDDSVKMMSDDVMSMDNDMEKNEVLKAVSNSAVSVSCFHSGESNLGCISDL